MQYINYFPLVLLPEYNATINLQVSTVAQSKTELLESFCISSPVLALNQKQELLMLRGGAEIPHFFLFSWFYFLAPESRELFCRARELWKLQKPKL